MLVATFRQREFLRMVLAVLEAVLTTSYHRHRHRTIWADRATPASTRVAAAVAAAAAAAAVLDLEEALDLTAEAAAAAQVETSHRHQRRLDGTLADSRSQTSPTAAEAEVAEWDAMGMVAPGEAAPTTTRTVHTGSLVDSAEAPGIFQASVRAPGLVVVQGMDPRAAPIGDLGMKAVPWAVQAAAAPEVQAVLLEVLVAVAVNGKTTVAAPEGHRPVEAAGIRGRDHMALADHRSKKKMGSRPSSRCSTSALGATVAQVTTGHQAASGIMTLGEGLALPTEHWPRC